MSKANIIIEKERRRVIKICRSQAEFLKELHIYNYKPDFAPALIDHNGINTLVLEMIDGIPIGDLLQPDFEKLADIFIQFHLLEDHHGKKLCIADPNPRNFLYDQSDHRYYLIDYSEWEIDYPESDLIHFLLFWASIYRTNRFREIFARFITAYRKILPLNPIEWELLVPEVLEKFAHRRHKFNKIEKKPNPDIKQNHEIMTRIYF